MTEVRKGLPTLSLVAPCYNEEAAVGLFFERVPPLLATASSAFEIICIDDGSQDGTLARLKEQKITTPELRIIALSRNFGKEAALSAGLDHAQGDVVVPIDFDLQDPPEIIPEFVARWRNGADVVVGLRGDRSADNLGKRFFAQSFYRVFNLVSDLPIPVNAGDFRLMDRAVVDVLRRMPERQRFMKGLMHWVGFRRDYVVFTRDARAVGSGKWRSWRLWNFALDGLLSFSTSPLRIWTYLGMAVATVGLAYMSFLIFRTLVLGIVVPGYASLAVLMLFSISVNMISIGIIGEYIGRIFLEVKARPLYIVASDTGATLGWREAARNVALAQ